MPPKFKPNKKIFEERENASKNQLNSITEANVAEKFALFWKNDFTK